jgi:hypothetical protein
MQKNLIATISAINKIGSNKFHIDRLRLRVRAFDVFALGTAM